MPAKNFVVIGGSRGIGLGIVELCALQGAQVTVLSRSSGSLDSVTGVRHMAIDVTQDSVTAEMLPETIDGFVYCPGSINLGPLRTTQPQSLRDDFELNVVGGLKCLQAALPAMRAAGISSAVFFSTVAVGQGMPMHSAVAASKGALEALVRTWAAELAPHIRVNCIAPALTDTPLAEKFLSTDEKRKAMDARYPLARIGQISDVAAAAEFLLSDRSTWITGQVIGVDGGMSTLRK